MAATGDARDATHSVADATHDLYRRYGKQIYAYCLHQLRSREEAEDAVQTTFLNAFRGLQRGTTTRFEQAWLYKIAQNVCIARRSSSGRRLRLESPDSFESLQEVVPSGDGSGDTLELMGLDEALERMPENQRRAILLREWQGLSYREIAAELNLSQGAVEMLIFRARRTLAVALDQPAEESPRTGKANTSFSFGSVLAALKALCSTGVAAKVAVVAAGAAVVGGNTVHAIVHRAAHVEHRHTSAHVHAKWLAPAAAPAQPAVARSAAAAVIRFSARTVRPAVSTVSGPPSAVVQDVTLVPAEQPSPETTSPPTVQPEAPPDQGQSQPAPATPEPSPPSAPPAAALAPQDGASEDVSVTGAGERGKRSARETHGGAAEGTDSGAPPSPAPAPDPILTPLADESAAPSPPAAPAETGPANPQGDRGGQENGRGHRRDQGGNKGTPAPEQPLLQSPAPAPAAGTPTTPTTTTATTTTTTTATTTTTTTTTTASAGTPSPPAPAPDAGHGHDGDGGGHDGHDHHQH